MRKTIGINLKDKEIELVENYLQKKFGSSLGAVSRSMFFKQIILNKIKEDDKDE